MTGVQTCALPISRRSRKLTCVSQGIVVLAAILFIIWRCTQRRFSEIEDGRDEIKWPELQPDGQNVSAATSTLNPMGTRRTGGAGMEMGERGEREDREESQWGDGEMASQGNEYYDHHDPGYDQSGYGSGHGGSSYCTFLSSLRATTADDE